MPPKTVFRVAAPVWGGAVVLLSLLPLGPSVPSAPGIDKVEHAAAYALLTLLCGFGYLSDCRRGWWRVFVVAVLLGGGMEAAQALLTDYRSAEGADLVANIIGAGSVSLLMPLLCRRWKRGEGCDA